MSRTNTRNLFFLFTLLLAGLFSVYWSTFSSLFMFWWNSPTYGYGILVMPISLYLVWRKRSEVCRSEIHPSISGLLLFAVINCIWWLANIVDIQVIQGLAFIMMISCLVLIFFGFSTIKIIFFPLSFLFIAIPIWGFLEPPLQNITVTIVTNALRLVDIPVFIENNFISIPEGQFFVSESCSGLRMFLVMLVSSLLYTYLYLNNYLKSVVYIIIALCVSVIVNWIRVFLVIFAGHVSDMKHFLVDDHVTFGWIMFGLSLIPLLWFGTILQRKELLSDGLSNNNILSNTTTRSYNNAAYIRLIISVSFIMIFTSLSAQWINKGGTRHVKNINIVAPPGMGAWVGPLNRAGYINPKYIGADVEITATYTRNSQPVNLYIAYYNRQQQGKELVNENNYIYDKKKWKKISERQHSIKTGQDKEYNVKEINLHADNKSKQILWYCYFSGGLFTPNHYVAKLLQVVNKLGLSKGSAVIILSMEYNTDPDKARILMEDLFSSTLLGTDKQPAVIKSLLHTTDTSQ